MNDLHPAPVDTYTTDHRSAANRDQMNYPTELNSIWIRAVENLAQELQIPPLEAYSLLRDAGYRFTQGMAWDVWLKDE